MRSSARERSRTTSPCSPARRRTRTPKAIARPTRKSRSSTFSARTGLADGPGCVYPASVLTLADQLATATLTWRAYVEDLPPAGSSAGTTGPTGRPAPTGPTGPTRATRADAGGGHREGRAGTASQLRSPTRRRPPKAPPAVPIPRSGRWTRRLRPAQTDPYTGFRNPFVYFDSLLGGGACAADDLGLEGLAGDLADAAQHACPRAGSRRPAAMTARPRDARQRSPGRTRLAPGGGRSHRRRDGVARMRS